MNSVTVAEMLDLERSWFARGMTAAELMEQAGWGIAAAIDKFFPQPGMLQMHLGKGHNAGDALCAARHLRKRGWRIECHAAFPEVEWAVLTRQQMRALEAVPELDRRLNEPTVIIDALLGIGARGALREPIRSAVERINEQRHGHAHPVIALDIPTGINADTGEATDLAVIADHTYFIGAPKRGLLASPAVNYVGRLEPILIGHGMASVGDEARQLITPMTFPSSLPLRPHDFHKGDAGRVTVVAGSRGMEGAALLCASAALRAGAGLVTLWVKEEILPLVASRACPALMIRGYHHMAEISLDRCQALAIGPGLGELLEEEFDAMVEMLGESRLPAVVDADALNAIARYQGHHCLRPSHVLTPHPGEFARLAPISSSRNREEACEHFTENHPSVLLLKGARTLIKQRGEPLYHNSTGHAGMATAGMGDVLTGVIVGLLAQGMPSITAASAGAWLCGRAGEIACDPQASPVALTAPDLISALPFAIHEWQKS